MSRAFTREDDNSGALPGMGERPVSNHRNLVTGQGLAEIDAQMAALRERLAEADSAADRERTALLSRDLRYWSSRRETAELSVPDRDSEVIRFGMTVTIEGGSGRRQAWTIVGEDEADAAKGKISHVSPMALALFGKGVGDAVKVGGREWEIVEVGV